MRVLNVLFFLLSPVFVFAQQYEVGIGFGASINSKPTNNMYFRGDLVAANYATQLTVLRNLKDDFQVGIDLHVLELSRRSSIGYTNDGYNIGADHKKIVYATYASSFCAVVNKKLYMDENYFYFGAGMGLAIARNNSKTLPVDASYEAPDGGFGLTVGLQVGYTLNFSNRFALNMEIAARYYDLDYTAEAPVVRPYTNIHYRIVAYPATVGIRYRLGYQKKLDPQTGETQIVK